MNDGQRAKSGDAAQQMEVSRLERGARKKNKISPSTQLSELLSRLIKHQRFILEQRWL